jgi:hypothetical protein
MNNLLDYSYFVVAGFTHSRGNTSHRIISPHFLSKEEAVGFIKSIPDLPADVKIWRTAQEAS